MRGYPFGRPASAAAPSAILAVAVAFFAVASPAGAQAEIAYRFKVGDRLPYSLAQKLVMETTAEKQKFRFEMTLTTDTIWLVKDVRDDGTAVLGQTPRRIRFRMVTPISQLDFDTRKPVEPAEPVEKRIAYLFTALVGQESLVTLTPRGQVKGFKLASKAQDAVKANPELQQLAAVFSEDGLRESLTQSLPLLPEGPAKPNATWANPPLVQDNQGVAVRTEIVNTLLGIERQDGRDVARIGRAMTVAFTAKPPIEVKLKSQSGKAEALFDVAAGRLLRSTYETKLAMEIKVMATVGENVIEQSVTLAQAKEEAEDAPKEAPPAKEAAPAKAN